MFNRLGLISQINFKSYTKTIAMVVVVFVGLSVLASGIIFFVADKKNDRGGLNAQQGLNSAVIADDSLDSDSDGLPDNLEKILGTNANKTDSDGDLYNDYEEVKNGYSPLLTAPSGKYSIDEFEKVKTEIKNFNSEIYDKIFIKKEEEAGVFPSLTPVISPTVSPSAVSSASPEPIASPSPAIFLIPAVLKEKSINKEWSYILYIPPDYDSAKTYPLVLVFYGTGGVISDSIDNWRSEADKNGFIIAALQPYEKRYPSGNVVESYPWGEASSFASSVLRDVKKEYNIDESNIFLEGFSTGAATAYIVALENGINFKGVIPIGGYLPLEAGIIDKFINSNSLNFYVIHGDMDDNLKAIIAQEKTLVQYGAKMDFITLPDFLTDEYPISEQENIVKWMKKLM